MFVQSRLKMDKQPDGIKEWQSLSARCGGRAAAPEHLKLFTGTAGGPPATSVRREQEV